MENITNMSGKAKKFMMGKCGNCSQAVFATFAKEMEQEAVDYDTCLKIASAFGGGIVADLSDGRRIRSSAFVYRNRYYRADAIVLPERGDKDQAVPSRFDQTLRFDVEAP